jgi:Mannosyltransferase (PIG-V)
VLGIRVLGLLVLVLAADRVHRSAHARLVRWDSQWYAGIAANGYGLTKTMDDGRHLADYAFFPLYPLSERALHALSGLSYVDAGLAISWVAVAVAAWGIYAVASLVHDARVGLLTALLWAALPVAIVTSMAYSEALFTALAAWALHAVLRDRWVAAGCLALLAGLTRPVGAAVVAAVVIPAVLQVFRARRVRPSLVVGAALAPLGWLGYVAWVGVRTGEPLGYFRVADGWGNGFDGGRALASWTVGLLTGRSWPLGVLLVAGVLVLLGLLVLAVVDRQPMPLLVYAGALVLLTLATSGYFGSRPRYLLPAFPLLVPVAVRMSKLSTRAVAGVVGALVVVSLIYGETWLLGPGPP